MSPRSRHLLLAWELLLALLAIEFGASFLALDRAARPLILIPAALMVAVVSLAFMDIRRGPETIRLCAAAGLLWLCILLGLGSLDPMTRVIHHVPTTNMK
jgi:cytochrome c oxidase subunit IV